MPGTIQEQPIKQNNMATDVDDMQRKASNDDIHYVRYTIIETDILTDQHFYYLYR